MDETRGCDGSVVLKGGLGMIYTISTADGSSIEWGLTDEERIVQNVLNILRTRKTEVPFLLGMGIDSNYLDNNIGYFRTNVLNDVTELIETYEPRATILNVSVENADANGNVDISVELEV